LLVTEGGIRAASPRGQYGLHGILLRGEHCQSARGDGAFGSGRCCPACRRTVLARSASAKAFLLGDP
jgi:hypothetical protein